MGIYDCDHSCAGYFFGYDNALMDFGYQYRLSKTVSPWETDYEVIDHSKGKISDPVSYVFEMGGVQ